MNGERSAIVNARAWDRQAQLALNDDQPMTAGRFEWTQYPGHGPGVELFGAVTGFSVVELGCGNGDNLAVLATAGAQCVGLDLAPTQINRALTRWGHLPITFRCTDARAFLAAFPIPLDICFSVFGAVGLCPPQDLLPLIADRLRRGGQLLFSVPHRQWLGQRRDHMDLSDGSRVPVARWTAGTAGWQAAVQAAGLDVLSVAEIAPPNGSQPCCIRVTAKRP